MEKKRYMGVEYYEGLDMAKGHMLSKAKEVYESLQSNHTIGSMNEAVELYNINKYVKDGKFLLYLGNDKEDWLSEKNKIANTSVGRYIASHQDILSEYKSLDFRSKNVFWEVVGERKLSSINENDLLKVLNEEKHFVWQIFRHKKLVVHFDSALRGYMLDNPEGSTNIILDKYLITHIVEKKKINLPPSLNLTDKEKIINDYLEIDNPNINYTRLLSNILNTGDFALDARIKLKAKRVSERLEGELFGKDSKTGQWTKIIVEFKDKVDGTVKQYFSLEKVGTEVEKSWLEENLDYPTPDMS